MTQSAQQPYAPAQILLVEDDAGDINLTRRALRKSRIVNDLHVVRDGEEALDFVHRRPPYTEAPRPDLILLDLGLPKLSGGQVLEQLKGDEHLRAIPVIVLTTSAAEEDITRSYANYVNSYITKPVEIGDFLEAVTALGRYWLSIVTLPDD